MKWIATILLLWIYLLSYAQINFLNPEFNSIFPINLSGVPPQDWDACSGTPDTNPNQDFPDFFAQSGNSCIGIGANYIPNWPPPIFVESIGQVLSQNLNARQTYHFTLWTERGFAPPCCPSPESRFKMFLGNGVCDSVELVYTSPYLDSFWTFTAITFTPTRNYNNVVFRAVLPVTNVSTTTSYVMLDNLSPIYTGPYTGITPDPKGEMSEVMVYPNPTNDGLVHLSISPDLQPTGLRVLDAVGRVVLSQAGVLSASLDLSTLPGGVYFVELPCLHSGGNEVVKRVKLIKN